ncbi:MAG: MBOAT family O-acyltransferase [Saccharofermentanaceae bacterium]|nr:MBOAT family O-acyltransferase [Saccharofermentanaceae bacterium]
MFSISTYFSIQYLALLLAAIFFYEIFPQKGRRWVLLISSYLFFYLISGKLLIYLLLSTLSIHHIGLWLTSIQNDCKSAVKGLPRDEKKAISAKYQKQQRKVMAFAVFLHIGVLLVLKYSLFAVSNFNHLMRWAHAPIHVHAPRFMIPIGISFYTLQALSYLFDVYREKLPADRNLMRLSMFMSFFPQIMEGPICRYSDTTEHLWNAERIKYSNFVQGGQRILYGVMKKLVLADRLNLLIETVFSSHTEYDGFVTIVAAVLYALQLYCDFSGTMDVVIGSAQIFGVNMPENFKRPFFSATISEFWKRWHVTLGTWFKDYVFFPMSMSKPLKKLTTKARKKLGNHFGPLLAGAIALFTVWLFNGLWHGAGWNFIFFGMFHFILILMGSVVEPLVIKVTQKLHIKRSSKPYKCFQIIRTSILVCIGEMFFRAESVGQGFSMLSRMFTKFSLSTAKDGSLFKLGMDRADFVIIGVSVIVIFVISVLQEKGIRIRESISRRNIAIQFAVFYALILFIVIFGAYGRGYIPVDPMYAAF